jgi:hypothetical protein
VDEEHVDFQEKIHLVQDDNDSIHLTQNDFKNPLNPKRQVPNNELSQESFSSSQYRRFFYALQEEMHKKYDLKPRKNVAK